MKMIFTTGDVAKICKVAPRTISKWFDAGKLGGYRIPLSQDRRIPRDALIRFLKEHGMPLGELEQRVVLGVGLDTVTRHRLREVLGDDIRFAGSVFAAGSLIERHRPAVAVVDMAVGRHDALEVAAALRGEPAAHVVLVAAEDEPRLSLESHADDVYYRPFDVALLAERVLALVEGVD